MPSPKTVVPFLASCCAFAMLSFSMSMKAQLCGSPESTVAGVSGQAGGDLLSREAFKREGRKLIYYPLPFLYERCLPAPHGGVAPLCGASPAPACLQSRCGVHHEPSCRMLAGSGGTWALVCLVPLLKAVWKLFPQSTEHMTYRVTPKPALAIHELEPVYKTVAEGCYLLLHTYCIQSC